MNEIVKYYKIQKELTEHYKDCCFLIKFNTRDNILEIIYTNRKYSFNDDFIDYVLLVCEKYLSNEELLHVAILYDYLNEVKYE